MPASRKAVKNTTQTTKTSKYVELSLPTMKRPQSLITPFLVLLLIIASFVIGSLYTRMQYLEQNGTLIGRQTATPPTTQEAFIQYAKNLKLDTDKFSACLKEGKYTQRVTAQLKEAESMGIAATPTFFINGKRIGGAYPYEIFKEVIDKELAGTGSENYMDYSEVLQQAYEDPNGRGFEPIPIEVKIGDEPNKGDKNPSVTIVEYSDFQCPFCQRAVPTMDQILLEYQEKVQLVYKHYPILSSHPNAQLASEASECAREQNKFWEYHDTLFTNQSQWAPLVKGI